METQTTHTAAGCRSSSPTCSRKWRTTAASPELRRCLHCCWQSDGKEQSLVSATLPPAIRHLQTRKREDVLPRTEQTLGRSNASSQGSWASTNPNPTVRGGCLDVCDGAPSLPEQLSYGDSKGRKRWEKTTNKPEIQQRGRKNPNSETKQGCHWASDTNFQKRIREVQLTTVCSL